MNQHPPYSVALHIGAHKTATTNLQRSFTMQQNALINAGVRYYGPESLRRPERSIADVFGLEVSKRPPRPTRSRQDQFAFMVKDGHRLVLSDENFIGVMHNKKGAMLSPLYPHAQKRVAALVDAVAPHPVDVFLSIRNPATFLTSAYGQALMGGLPMSFEEYIAKNPLDLIDWAALVARLRAIPNLGEIIVWRFEEYRWRFYKATAAMMGPDADIRIAPIPNKVHIGPSEAAVDYILSQGQADCVDEARARFPVSDANPAFAPFDAAQIGAATEAYDAQIAQIDQMGGVTILRA